MSMRKFKEVHTHGFFHPYRNMKYIEQGLAQAVCDKDGLVFCSNRLSGGANGSLHHRTGFYVSFEPVAQSVCGNIQIVVSLEP